MVVSFFAQRKPAKRYASFMSTSKIKGIFFYLLTFLVSCSPLTNTKLLKLPSQDFRLDTKTLRTNGYYYCEKERIAYCKFISGVTSGIIADTNSKYNEKYISAFMLYLDGYSYFTGGRVTSGVNRPGAASWTDRCNLIKDFNNFDQARNVFEEHLSKNNIGYHPLHDKGIFNLKGDSILFQVYASGSQTLVLTEYNGIINNDSTFTLLKELIYDKGKKPRILKLNDIYHFKQHNVKADSTNYLRDHRAELDK
jgi:hypothetical protein